MAALTSSSVSTAGLLAAGAAVSASDTILAAQFGPNGLYMRVINGGGSPDNVTVLDPNRTQQGSPASPTPVTVTNGTTKTISIPRSAIDPATGYATVTHSFTTTVTYELQRV